MTKSLKAKPDEFAAHRVSRSTGSACYGIYCTFVLKFVKPKFLHRGTHSRI
jgi:hypothetical protein